MSTLSLTRVNQKLGQAKSLLQGSNEALLSVVQRDALVEGTAFHLICAYQHYLRELAETYGLKNAAYLRTETDLVNAFEAGHKHPAEAEELLTLRNTPNSWLAQLQNFYDSLWQVPRRQSPVADEPSLITLVNIDAAPELPPVSLQSLREWHGAFVVLVRRQRETSAEF